MKYILLFLVFATTAYADPQMSSEKDRFRLFQAEKLEIKYSKLDPNDRDPMAPQYTGRWANRASLLWRVSVLESLYWDNDVHTETIDSGQVKTVGWHWEAGFRLNKYMTVFEEHHSRHVMDEPDNQAFPTNNNQFPVENSYGIKLIIIDEKTGKSVFDSLFGK